MKKTILRPNGTKKVVTVNPLPSLTQKQFKNDVDVNNIIKKFKKTGQISHIRNTLNGVYSDLTHISDLLDMKLKVIHAEQAFMELPPKLRSKFRNDPAELISYLQNPSNHEEAIHLGLMVKRDDLNDAKTPKSPTEASSTEKT